MCEWLKVLIDTAHIHKDENYKEKEGQRKEKKRNTIKSHAIRILVDSGGKIHKDTKKYTQ